MKEIKAVYKDFCNKQVFYEVGKNGVTKIEEGCKPTGITNGIISKQSVFYFVKKGSEIIAEVGAGKDLVIIYK